MRSAACALLLLFALALGGCAASKPKPYRAEGTADCLRKAGYHVLTDADRLGAVAASASLGALRASEPGNNVTISFGETQREAANITKLYRRFAPAKLARHIDDVMEVQKNAVLLWGVHTPPPDERDKVVGCLES